ncbi:MAG: EMC3/TMCO1 family protein [Candidatus Bathyarchaeia archaeon]
MFPTSIPYSTIFIFLLAATISFLMTLVNRLLTNPENTKAWRKEVMDWQQELRKAQKSGDKKTVEKLMKKQKQILQLQSKMMWQSMKVTLLFFIPLIVMWQILGGFYGATSIAYFPGIGSVISIPLFGNLFSLFWWYMLCSLLFSTLFSHLFGLVSVE